MFLNPRLAKARAVVKPPIPAPIMAICKSWGAFAIVSDINGNKVSRKMEGRVIGSEGGNREKRFREHQAKNEYTRSINKFESDRIWRFAIL
jgi:hypothetical protein